MLLFPRSNTFSFQGFCLLPSRTFLEKLPSRLNIIGNSFIVEWCKFVEDERIVKVKKTCFYMPKNRLSGQFFQSEQNYMHKCFSNFKLQLFMLEHVYGDTIDFSLKCEFGQVRISRFLYKSNILKLIDNKIRTLEKSNF